MLLLPGVICRALKVLERHLVSGKVPSGVPSGVVA